jgi:hypothetical protein
VTVDQALKDTCDRLRVDLRAIELQVRGFRNQPAFNDPESYPGQHGEMIAQSMLAVRDIEAARMRLGKVLQYAGDGVSIYDKA